MPPPPYIDNGVVRKIINTISNLTCVINGLFYNCNIVGWHSNKFLYGPLLYLHSVWCTIIYGQVYQHNAIMRFDNGSKIVSINSFSVRRPNTFRLDRSEFYKRSVVRRRRYRSSRKFAPPTPF